MNTQDKDIDRFIRVYEENKALVFATALHYCKDTSVPADDIVQEVFLRLYIHFDKLAEHTNLTAWLVFVTKNVAINYIKKSSWEISTEEVDVSSEDETYESMDEYYIAKCNKESRINEALSILDAVYQKDERWFQVLTMIYCFEKDTKEIADELGVTVNLVHTMNSRARKWIRKKFNAEKNICEEEM